MRLLATSTLFSAIILSACSGSEQKVQSTSQSLDIYSIEDCSWQNGDSGAPKWLCNPVPSDDKFVIFAVGQAKTSKYDTSLSKNTARADAQAELQRQIEVTVKKGLRSASVTTGEVGSSDETLDTSNAQVLNLLIEGSVKNTRILKNTSGPDGYTYVLAGIAREGFDDLISSSVNSSMGNAKAQYQMMLSEKIQEQFNADFLNQQHAT